MSTTIPSYPQPCLAADETNSAVYLVGVSPAVQGRLEVNYVSMVNVNTPTSSPVGFQVNTAQWSSGAPKACFIHPAKIYANSPLSVFQFGNYVSYSTTITPSGAILKGDGFVDTSFLSPKLFALSGSVGSFEWFLTMTNSTGNPWAGIRLNFTDPSEDILDMELTNYPTTSPMVAVGTYSTVTNPPSKGYSVIFDKLGQGQIFSASGSMIANMTNDDNVLVLSPGVDVQMNSITLTDQAVPVTMLSTGYILDKAQDGSTVVYSITPEKSSALQRIDVKGGSPSFSAAFAATALNKQIITYAPSTSGSPTFNSFDTTTRTWSGPGLMSNGGGGGGGGGINPSTNPTPEPSKTPTAGIIGGVLGALVVIAVAAFFVIRHRRKGQQQQKRTENSESANHSDSADKVNGGVESGQKDYLQDLPSMQQMQYYQPQSFEQQYPASPTIFVPPPPPVNPNAVTSFEAYRPTSTDGTPSELNITPYDSPYISPSSYNRDSTYSATPAATAVSTNQDYSYAKSRGSSYGGSGAPLSPQLLSPQLYPQDEENNARSPQSFASASPNPKHSSP